MRSSGRDDSRSGRSPAINAIWETRALRFAERVAPNVATARTKVPAAVASDANVVQSIATTTARSPQLVDVAVGTDDRPVERRNEARRRDRVALDRVGVVAHG